MTTDTDHRDQPQSIPTFDLSDRMRKSLRHAEVGVGEIAAYLDVSRETVSRWINGKTAPTGAVVRLWALRTGVPHTWLKTGETPPPDGDGASVVRPKGFEPLTSCLLAALARDLHGYEDAA